MSMRVSRRGRVEPFHVMELLKAAHERQVSHGDVITMCAGQPSTPAPAVAREAAVAALQDGAVLGYTPAMGIPALQQTIAEHYADWYDLQIDPNSVAITTGSSAGFTALFLAAFDAGDVVLMTRPGYPAYRNTLQALGCRPVELECGPEVRFQPTLAMLQEWSSANGAPPAGLIIAAATLLFLVRGGVVADGMDVSAVGFGHAFSSCFRDDESRDCRIADPRSGQKPWKTQKTWRPISRTPGLGSASAFLIIFSRASTPPAASMAWVARAPWTSR